MQVFDIILKCAAFVGTPTEAGFTALGTGFFVVVNDDENAFAYFVSASHVIWPGRKSKGEAPKYPIVIRINKTDGTSRQEPAPFEKWAFHADRFIDVCAYPLGVYPQRSPAGEIADDMIVLNLDSIAVTPKIAEAMSVGLGDEVFITGAFVGRVGERRNIPVVRFGNIAAMNQEPMEFFSPKRNAYLVESRSLGGISGSPVFVRYPHRSNMGVSRNSTGDGYIIPFGLLGMMLGNHSGKYAEDFVSEGDDDVRPSKDVDFNAGIGVVMSVDDIVEFLETDPMLKGMRQKSMDERRSRIGGRLTSAAAPLKG